MLREIDVIAWGFDGVLNKKPSRSHFSWLRQLTKDPRLSCTNIHKASFRISLRTS